MKHFLFLIALILLTSCSNSSLPLCSNTQPNSDTNNWNIWLYLNGDNNLNDGIQSDVEELLSCDAGPSINTCLQVDLANKPAERFCIKNGIKSPTINIGEVDMSKQQTLTNFINWAKAQSDADQTILVLSDHGNGWDQKTGPSPRNKISARSMFVDYDNDSPSTPSLQNYLIAEAIKDANVELDILGLDASIMGTIEALVEFSDLADVLITSQEVGFVDGWKYDDILSQLSANPAMDSETFASAIVTSYETYYENNITEKRYSIAAHRSQSIDLLADEINQIAMELLSDLDSNPTETIELLKTSRENTQKIDPIVTLGYVYIDLKDFLIQVELFDGKIAQYFEEATIKEYHGSEREDANGISIVFFKTPTASSEDNCIKPGTAQTDWPCVTFDRNYKNWDEETGTGNKGKFLNNFQWDELLQSYYNQQKINQPVVSHD